MDVRSSKSRGFTVIELLLAMTFLTFILLFVITATIQIMRVYNKGVATKTINQSGRTIVEEMSREIRGANPSTFNTSQMSNGRLCLGEVSYIWNLGNTMSGANKYTDNTPISFVRVKDPSGLYCDPSQTPTKAAATELISNTIWVQQVSVIQSVASDSSLVQLRIRLSTSDINSPNVLDNGEYVCSGSRDGDFCAVVDFTTVAAIRNIGE
jgi:Tfp pilus assembly protein PilV